MNPEICDKGGCFLCRHCLPEWKATIAVNRQVLQFKKGQSVFKEGDDVRGIYFIYSGGVKIHQSWGREKDFILRFATAGDVVGHRAQGWGETFAISATALTPSQICFITNEFLETTLRINPAMLYAMMHLYAIELHKAELRMRNLALMHVKGRVAEALLTIRDVFGVDGLEFLNVPITRADIAGFAGTTYEAVFRLLTEWTREGLVSTSGKTFRIINEERLRDFIHYQV